MGHDRFRQLQPAAAIPELRLLLAGEAAQESPRRFFARCLGVTANRHVNICGILSFTNSIDERVLRRRRLLDLRVICLEPLQFVAPFLAKPALNRLFPIKIDTAIEIDKVLFVCL